MLGCWDLLEGWSILPGEKLKLLYWDGTLIYFHALISVANE